ncbi:unnamed protein product [Mytilus edulis]|uniref:DDE Tnp4 domain-containing protein n=1 Tax=Mytilus edulis TaxID=6550 RepID=A0A8S3SN97_MYTED|nr:unnamed protein product [Mytilus edulis]
MPSGDACQPQSTATDNETEHNKLKEKIRDLEKALEQEKNINTNLLNEKNMLSNKLFRYNNFKNSDTKIKELTGLPDNHTFDILFTLFDKPKQYWSYDKKILDGNFGRHRALSPQDEFFMYLLRLRQDISETVLASMFNVSISTVSCILSTWACHMKSIFSKINMNPTMDELQTLCPPDILKKFPNCVMILDCTEFEVDEPSELDKQSVFWSEYWSRHTAKVLVGCTLWGSLSFISDLFPGSTTDVEMCTKSGLLDNIKKGEVYMADKGFTLQRQFQEKGAQLLVPPFANKNKKQFNPQQVEKPKHIAATRIFVEQAIGRIKSYRFLTRRIPISSFKLASIHIQNIAYLTNFQRSFVTAADPILVSRRKVLIEKFCKQLLQLDENEENTEENIEEFYIAEPIAKQNVSDGDPDIPEIDVREYDEELVLGLVDLLIEGEIETDEVYSIC